MPAPAGSLAWGARMLRFPGPSRIQWGSLSQPGAPLPVRLRTARRWSGQAVTRASGAQVPWLIVGLGNPGSKYAGTRHNVGFDMVDAIAAAEGIKMSVVQHKSVVGKGSISGTPVLLAKPQTYVNASGEAVGPMAAYYRIPVERVLVIVDCLDLDFAVMRLLPRGGHGGHNGVKSVVKSFKGSTDFPRLRLGIGRPPASMHVNVFVLQRFSPEERAALEFSFQKGVEAVRMVASQGIEHAVSTWNENRRARTPQSVLEQDARFEGGR